MVNLKHMGRLGKVYWAYGIRNKTRIHYPPYRLWIEPTSRCNLRCVMCPNKELKAEDQGFMDFDLFRKIVDEAKGFIHDANLHHRGESLLHRRLGEMIRYASRSGIRVKLHTNATLLTEVRAREIVDSGLDLISFSFDGLDKETYQRYRVGARFEDTLEKIRTFLSIKKASGRSRPFAVLEVIDFSGRDAAYDLGRRGEFQRSFEGLSLDRFIVKKPHNFGGHVRMGEPGKRRPYAPCTFPWHSLVIFWNGDVCACPQDFYGQNRIGNVNDASLVDLFTCEGMIRLRKMLLAGLSGLAPPCFRCDMTARRRFLGVPLRSLRHLER